MSYCPSCKREYPASSYCPVDGLRLVEQSQEGDDSLVGQLVGNYRLMRLLGAGGMGSVYEARHALLPRRAAIKLLHPIVASRPNTASRFIQEAKISAALSHPNIVQILDFGQRPDGSLYLVMELLEGRSLSAWLKESGVLPPDELLLFLRPVCSGLSAAHRVGVIHRDLKPDNIFLAEEIEGASKTEERSVRQRATIKLLDFGLAKLLHGSDDGPKTVEGTLLGTPLCMSPEQINGDEIDARSDIYSLGVIMYEALTGSAPFRGERWAVLRGHMMLPPPPMAGVPAEVERIITQCLAKITKERPQSVDELLSRLEAVLPSAKPMQEKPRSTTERRQMTVLAGVTPRRPSGESLDPEELIEGWEAKRALFFKVLHEHGGVLREASDALLGLFGYPIAKEDDARRAAAAAEALLALRCVERVGIHTSVMLSDAKDPSSVMGEALSTAPALALLADRAGVLCSKETRALLERFYQLTPVSSLVAGDLLYWLGAPRTQHSEESTAELIGRAQEMSILEERWRQSQQRRGQIVLLGGEPGIGKSRLLQSLREQNTEKKFLRLECACAPQYQGSSFFPVEGMLHRLLGWSQETSPEERVTSVDRLLAELQLQDEAPLFYSVLSLPSTPDTNPRERQQRTLDALVALILQLSERQPVLLLIEDAHWLDPSTLSWLSLLVESCEPYSIFLVITHRPEFIPAWGVRANQSQIVLGRLVEDQSQSVIAKVTQNKPLPRELEEHIIDKADGVPLFIEELTKSWIESGFLLQEDGRYTLTRPLASLSVPMTLKDSLMARIDRLEEARSLAQLGSVIGREFSMSLLRWVYTQGEPGLQRDLQRLLSSGLVQRRGVGANATYLFKHALIQDVAYQSLIKTNRQGYHRIIAQALEAHFPEVRKGQPEIIARHYTEAGETSKAAEHWCIAANAAAMRVANIEARALFEQALVLLAQLPQDDERTRRELEVLIPLGGVLMALLGYDAHEVGVVYQRALSLAKQLRHPGFLIPALLGYWLHCILKAQLSMVSGLSGELLQLAEQLQSREALFGAHMAESSTRFWLGDFTRAVLHSDKSIEHYNSGDFRERALLRGGQDPQVFCQVFSSLALWCLGYPQKAQQLIRSAVALSRQLRHNFSLALSLEFLYWIDLLCGEPSDACEELHAISLKYGFPHFLELAKLQQGMSALNSGQLSEEDFERLLHQSQAKLGRMPLLIWSCVFILPWQVKTGRHQRALAFVEKEYSFGGVEFAFHSEMYGVHAELIVAQGKREEASALLERALVLSRQQEARSLELRALLRMTRHYQGDARLSEVLRQLRHTYDWFTEGHQTKDLRAAKVVLEQA